MTFFHFFWICGILNLWFIDFNTESVQNNIIHLLLLSQVLIKSRAMSIAFASAVKIEEPSGMRVI